MYPAVSGFQGFYRNWTKSTGIFHCIKNGHSVCTTGKKWILNTLLTIAHLYKWTHKVTLQDMLEEELTDVLKPSSQVTLANCHGYQFQKYNIDKEKESSKNETIFSLLSNSAWSLEMQMCRQGGTTFIFVQPHHLLLKHTV